MPDIIAELTRVAAGLRTEAARLTAIGDTERACYAIHSARAAEQLAGIKQPKPQRDMLEELT